MNFSKEDFTETQLQVLGALDADKYEIADVLSTPFHQISPNTAKSHIENLREKGASIRYDSGAGQYVLDDPDLRQLVTTDSPAPITRQRNKWRKEQRNVVERRLARYDPVDVEPRQTEDGVDMTLMMGDTHFGDVVTDDGDSIGETVESYHTELATESVREVTRQVLQKKEMVEATGRSVDRLVVAYLGDMITAETTYEGQQWHVDRKLHGQISAAAAALKEQIATLADAFPEVVVVGLKGNHGQSNSKGSSDTNNFDLSLYGWLFSSIRERELDNVQLAHVDDGNGFNVELRSDKPLEDGGKSGSGDGWTLHLRHGHRTRQTHVDATAASSRDWRGIRDNFDMDMAARGHHHTRRREDVLGSYPVWTNPSPKPGGDFAELVGQPDVTATRNLATVITSSDAEKFVDEWTVRDVHMDYYEERVSDDRKRLQADVDV